MGTVTSEEAGPMSDFREGDQVKANRDVGGIFDSNVSEGSTGEVLGSTLFGDHYQVRFGSTVHEVSAEDIRRDGGGLFD